MASDWERSLGEDVAWLARLAREAGLEEIEVTDAGRTIRVRRAPAPERDPSTPVGDTDAAAAGDTGLGVQVRAEHVGIFHRAPEGADEPVARDGSHVEEGQPVGFVDVLGVPHEVVAPASGTLDSFEAMDGQPVEFGQTVARLLPDGDVPA
jgi:biotin carboxyl carrier protein